MGPVNIRSKLWSYFTWGTHSSRPHTIQD